MTGGTLDSVYDFQVYSGGTATLSGVTVKDYINNSGTLNMEGCSINNYITSSGELNMSGVVSTSYIEAMGATTLDGVTCTTLRVDSDADVSTGEGGVTLTGEEAIRLQNFSGNVATLLNSFAWSTEAEGAYIGITGTLGDSTFTALPETLAGGYNVLLNSDVTIAAGKTVTLEEGICWQLLKTTNYYRYLNVAGTLVVDNETVADALVSVSGAPCLRVNNGGKVQLTNANVTGFYDISMQSGGTFEMTGGTLDSVYDFQVGSGGTATLSGVTVKDNITASGALVLEDCAFSGATVQVYNTATISMVNTSGIKTLTIDGRATVTEISGNDFSGTTVSLSNLSADKKIDLSGNYWGEGLSKEQIIAKISGYNEDCVILDSWLVGLPEAEFAARSLVGDTLASAGTRSMTVKFSHMVDESTIAGNIYLENLMGDRVEITGWSQANGELTLQFDALPADGLYHVVLGAGLKNEYGKSLTVKEGNADCRFEFSADILAESVESIRLPQSDAPGYFDIMLSGEVDGSTLRAADIRLLTPGGEEVSITRAEMHTTRIIRVYVASLPEAGEYALTLPSSLTDAAGNCLVQAGSAVNFTVESTDPAIVPASQVYSGLTNGSVEVRFSVSNAGNLAVENGKVEIWLTANGVVSADSVLLDIATVESLAAGGSLELTRTLLLSDVPGLAEGSYQLVATVSGAGELKVLADDNSAGIGTLEVSYPPAADIALGLKSAATTLTPGAETVVALSIANHGTVTAASVGEVVFGIIPAGGSVAGMVQIGSFDLSNVSLAVGSNLAVNRTLTIPGDVKLDGSVQLVAVLKTDTYEQPGTTANNTALTEAVLLEKLLSISASVASITEGSSTRVAYTITRTGDCSQALVVNLSSEQAARLGLPQTVTISAGQSSARVQARVVNDKDYTGNVDAAISVSAAGYTGASTKLTIVDDEKPSITIALEPVEVTEGADAVVRGTVSINTICTVDTIVKLGSNFSNQIKTPSSVTIKAGESSVSFEAAVVDDNTAEIDKNVQITGAANGFNSGSATVKVVDNDLPEVELVLSREIVSESDGYYALTATLVRRGGSNEAITVKLQDVDGIGLILPSSVPMGAGVQSVKFTIGVVDDALANGERTGRIRGSIIIDDCGCDASSSTDGGTLETTLTVQDNDSPALTVKLSKSVLREGGAEVATLTVTSNYVSDVDVVVSLTDGGVLNLPATITIPAGSTSASCEVSAKADGVSDGTQYTTIMATADGFISGRGYMQVTDMDVPDLVVDSITLEGAAIAGQQSQVRVTVHNQGYASTSRDTVVEIYLTNGTLLGTTTLPAGLEPGESITLETVVSMPEISGKFGLTATVDTHNALDELDNDNNYKLGDEVQISSGYDIQADVQQSVVYGDRSIRITGSVGTIQPELPLEGVTLNLYLCQKNATVISWQVTTDAQGAFVCDYKLPEGLAGAYEIYAGIYSREGEVLDSFSVASLDVTASYMERQWLLKDGESLSGSFTVVNNGNVDLTGVRLVPGELPPNISFEMDTDGVSLKAGESTTLHYTITGNGFNTGTYYSEFSMSVQSNEGVSDSFKAYSYVDRLVGELLLDVQDIKFSSSIDGLRYAEVKITNIGGADTGAINISIPDMPWLSVYTASTIENLAPGESTTVVLKFDPTQGEVISNAPYSGRIAISAENATSKAVDYNVRFVSSSQASLNFVVQDSFNISTAEDNRIAGARVTLYDSYTLDVVSSAVVDENGEVNFDNLTPGYYNYKIQANGYSDYKGTVQLMPGEAAEQDVYLTGTTVTYTFTVVPTEIEDKYEIVQEVTYVTNVPKPIIVFNNNETLYLPELEYGETYYITATVSNYGLVAAQDYRLELPQWDGISLTILNPIDHVDAMSSHEFVIRIDVDDYSDASATVDDKGSYFNLKCIWGTSVNFWFDCTEDGYWVVKGDVKTDDDCTFDKPEFKPNEDKEERPSKGPGGSGPVSSGGGDYLIDWSFLHCDPCLAVVANILLYTTGNASYSGSDIITGVGWEGVQASKYNPADLVSMDTLITVKGASAAIDATNTANSLSKVVKKQMIKCGQKSGVESIYAEITARNEALSVEVENLRTVALALAAPFDLTPLFTIPVPLDGVSGGNVATGSVDKSGSSVEEVEYIVSDPEHFETFLTMLREFVGSGVVDGLVSEDGTLSDELVSILKFSDEEIKALCGTDFARNLGAIEHVLPLLRRWNRTVEYYQQGILSVADVPDGMSTDFFSTEYYDAWSQKILALEDKAHRAGYYSYTEYYNAVYNALNDYVAEIRDGVCSSVRLEFKQTATMTREAFDGTFTLTNGNTMGELTNVSFSVYVQDMNGVDVSDHFRISYYGLDGLDSLESGTLGSGQTAEVKIQYIADRTIAQEGPTKYLFGANLSYTDPLDGVYKDLMITPVQLTVNPSPELHLHYFLTEDVYSDDPFTAGIEAAQRAEIGLIVSNTGNGVAKNFTMSDFHPSFKENEKGLALELTMLGGSLNGGALEQAGTTLMFGDIDAHSTSTAIWYFQTNLQGYFTDYSASFTRVDSLGDKVLVTNGTDVSLIEEVSTHLMTRSFDADGDGKTDFLVNDKSDTFDMADGIYFGDGSYADVNGVTGIRNTTGTLGMGNNTIQVTMFVAEGWNYFRIDDPGQGNYRIESISVNGKQLDADMFWQTDRVFAVDGTASYKNRLHWVAEFTRDSYATFEITYSAVDSKAPGVASFGGVMDKSTVRESLETVTVRFDEAVNPDTFSLDNISLKLQNEYLDLTGLTWEWQDDKTLVLTNLQQFTQWDGLYVLKVLNGGVEDVYGNAGDGSGRQVMWTKATSKVAIEYIEGLENRKLNASVDYLLVNFTQSVAVFNTDALIVTHTSAEGAVTEITDLNALTISRLNAEGTKYQIEGLSSIQNLGDGTYHLTVDNSKVIAYDGQAGTGASPAEWKLYQTLPKVINSSVLMGGKVLKPAESVYLTFNHGVTYIREGAVSLLLNGEKYSDMQVSWVCNGSRTVEMQIISAASNKASSVLDGDWQIELDLSGVEDIYGNKGQGVFTKSWAVDTTAPVEIAQLTVNGSDAMVVADTRISVAAVLPESGLTVSIYDRSVRETGLGTLLWIGTVTGTELNRVVTLNGGGSRVLSVITADASGNSTTNTYNVLVDMVALTVETDLEAKYKEHPDSVVLTFNAAIAELPLSALSLVVNGTAVSLDGATVSKVSDTEWKLSGLSALCDTVGSYTFGVDLSQLTKSASGLAGQGSYTQSYAYDPITEVRITSCELSSEVELVTGLRMAFNADINYAALQAAGLLGAAMRLVNQEDGSVVLLDAAGFAYADKVLSWSGELSLPGGHYAVVVDTALLKAANGSPLVGNAGTADTAIVDYRGDALLLGAAGTSYSAPYAVDWNGDGHADLLVGEMVGSAGKVRLYLNNGSGGFANFRYLQSNGADLSVSASGCQGVVVALQDITGDGVADLVAGLSNGEVQYFTGLEGGSFGSASTLVEASVAGSRAYPVFADWNADGVADLVLGTGSGSLMVGLGSMEAATGALSFATPTLVAGIEVPGRAAPVFTDVNADGREDLILGAGDGSLTLYYGTEGGFSRVGSWQLEGISWERSRVTVADLNADGRTDLIVGGSTGDIYVVYGAAPANRWSQQVEIESGMAITATGVAVNAAVVTLSWNAVNTTSETRYVVEVADNADFANATVYSGLERTILTLDSHAEGVYFWRVRIEGVDKPAVNGSGYTVDTIAPGAPDSLVASAVGNTAVLTWAAQTDASGVKYEVRCSATEDFSSATVITTTEPRLNVSGLPAGEWYWQVRAVDGAGNAGVWSTAAESFHIDEVETPESTTARYWARGLVTSGAALVSGYWDADKSGTGDTQLCWAAADANMLAWWQRQYGVTDFSSSDVPESADDIFSVFKQNWANVSGREEYGLTWWVSGVSENGSYGSFYTEHFTGHAGQGAYYAPHYDAAATSALVKEVSLTGVSAAQIARDWADVYADGGIISLGVYSSLSGSSLVGGHALTVWGFATDAAGRLSSITVTDSDDGVDAAVTLSLAYNVTKGYYQIAQSGTPLNGRLLGDYTSLAAFDKQDAENNTASGAGTITMTEPENGASMSTAARFDWVGTGDAADFYEFTAPGVGIYRVNVNTRELDSDLLISVGSLDSNGDFVVEKQAQIKPNSSISGISGLRLDGGEQQYIRISAAEGGATSYELTVRGDIDEASPITDNNVKQKATKVVGTIQEDATISSWVGSGDALDLYYFELTEECNFSLSLSGLDKNAKVKLYYDNGDGTYGSIISNTVRASRGLEFNDALAAGTYYLEIASYDKGAGRYNTAYTLELEKETDGVTTRLSLESDSPLTDNNTKETATELELVSVSDAVITSWVGAGDALDYYRFEVSQAGTLGICLSELEKNTTLRLYQGTEDGYNLTMSSTVRASRGLDTELDLTVGTYYLEIASYDNGAGRYNTTYALELEKEEDGEVKRYAIAGSGL